MVNLYWSSGNPLDCFDNPNCFFNAQGIGQRREESDPGYVVWFPPGYMPPAQPKKKKPFRRKAKTTAAVNPTPTPTNTMSTFRYNTGPMANGKFTTRAVVGAVINQATLDTNVAALTGVPVDKCPLVFIAYLRQFLTCAQTGGWADEAYEVLRMKPTAGGSQVGPDDFHTPDDINAGVSLSYTSAAIAAFRSTLTLERHEDMGFLTPVIDNIMCTDTDMLDHYVIGGGIRLEGSNLKFSKANVLEGIFAKPAAGAEVRLTTYLSITDTEILAVVPAALSGPLTIRAAAAVNGATVRSFTYSTPITN